LAAKPRPLCSQGIPPSRQLGHDLCGIIRCAALKDNQPKLWDAAVEAGNSIDLDHPDFETEHRGHGRIDRHRAWSEPVPQMTAFPHASRFIIVERESSTLDDVLVSIETRFYVTDLTEADASVEHLLRMVRGHWSIESLHWVRSPGVGLAVASCGADAARMAFRVRAITRRAM